MIIGVPKEIKNNENRVALTPAGVLELTKRGHTVYVQSTAGLGSGFSDQDYKNAGAKIKKTIETKEVYYFSRSRKQIWHKGKTSGFTQKVTEIRIDDDQDSIWMTVDIGDGSSCHVGYRSCFYRSVPLGKIKDPSKIEMKFKEKKMSAIFQIIKFRTMNVNQNSNLTISIAGDKRITRIGKILRKYKIDELPELINILRGEMSFVGPRPDVAGYADKLLGDDRKILQLRPGITSSASLKYSNEEHLLSIQKNPKSFNANIIFPDKVRMNLKYYKNHNIWLDIKIIFATVFRLNY